MVPGRGFDPRPRPYRGRVLAIVTSRACRRCRRVATPRLFPECAERASIAPQGLSPPAGSRTPHLSDSARVYLPALVELGAPPGNRNRLTSLQGRCIATMLAGQSVLGAGSVNRTPEGRLRNGRFATSLSQHEEQMLRSAGNQSTGSSPMSYQSDLAAGTRVRGDGQRLVLWQRCTCLGDFVRDFSLPGGRGRARCRLVFAPLGAIDHGFHARKRPRPLIERRGGGWCAIMPEHWMVRFD